MADGANPRLDLVSILARGIAAIGTVRLITGIGAWFTVRSQLAAERIVVPESAPRFPGRRVTGPLTAFEEASVIRRIALAATGGRTYSELAEGDPVAETAMDASLLRSSLFTSVLAYGMAASEIGEGLALIAIGEALRRLTRQLPSASG